MVLKEKESDFKFLDKKISVLKFKNKELESENDKISHELNNFKEKNKELEKKLKK